MWTNTKDKREPEWTSTGMKVAPVSPSPADIQDGKSRLKHEKFCFWINEYTYIDLKFELIKGALSRQFCYILVKTAQIFDKESVF